MTFGNSPINWYSGSVNLMFNQTKKLQIAMLVGLALLMVASAQVYFYFKKAPSKNFPENLKYSQSLSEERRPLPNPKDQSWTVKIPILMYHHIGELPPKASQMREDLTVSANDFEEQVKWLKDSGYTSIHLNDILLYSQGEFTMPKKSVVFTFDDGYDDVFINTIPILKKYGFNGTFGIITQYPKTVSSDSFYASWEDIAAAYQAGNEIVCHTQNHFDGLETKYTPEYIFQNLSGCQLDIKNHLGIAEPIMIYPYGRYNASYIKQANRTGIIMGVTVHEGDIINLDNLMEIPRVRVHGHQNFEKFKLLVAK